MKQFLFAWAMVFVACVCTHAADGARKLPRPDRVVIVFEENRAYSHIIGNMAAPFINTLANRGASFTQSYAITHPSQPNYLAFFSGSTHNIVDNRCVERLSGPNLASALIAAGHSFAIYSEDLPAVGFAGCRHGHYERKHNPAVNWQGVNLPLEANRPFTDFPTDFAKLPTVSIVVPNQENDMHNGNEPDTIIRGDAWLRKNLAAYVEWADKNNSLLIVTWDEDDGTAGNRIPTIFVGPMVKKGVYARRIDHYSVLRTLLDMYGLLAMGNAAKAAAIDDVWIAAPRINTR